VLNFLTTKSNGIIKQHLLNNTLHAGQLEKGQILESVLDELEFENDTYYDNPSDAANRNTDTESRQRAKTLDC